MPRFSDPVTAFGASFSPIGWAHVGPMFQKLATRFSNCSSCEWGVVAADVGEDFAYLLAIERTTSSVGREGATGKVLPEPYAPSTLGTFLRAFTFGHVRQLGAVAAGLLTSLAGLAGLLSGAKAHRDAVTWLDVDDTMRETHGYAKQAWATDTTRPRA